jgi:hypothetical protein
VSVHLKVVPTSVAWKWPAASAFVPRGAGFSCPTVNVALKTVEAATTEPAAEPELPELLAVPLEDETCDAWDTCEA